MTCSIRGIGARPIWRASCARRVCGAVVAMIAISAAARPASAGERSQVARLSRTMLVCEPLGLGAIDSVPFNFPGASEADLEPLRTVLPGLVEIALPAGGNPHVPRVFGSDLGAPFEHSDGRSYFIFDDAELAPAEGIAPNLCDANGVCGPRVVNNDFLATSTQLEPPTRDACLTLAIESAAGEPTQFKPLSYNGLFNQGGANLGGGVVPGPGFSTGKFIFTLMPLGGSAICTLSEAGNSCAQTGGIEGDVCAPLFGPTLGQCYFGECLDSPDSPCALRYPPTSLAVRTSGSAFVTPQVGVHLSSERVLEAYRGHFSTASFFSKVDFKTGDGRVWVVGRDGYWGTQGMKMDPYLMFHPVTAGQLGEAQYFAGMSGGQPVFSADRRDAKPLFAEHAIVPNHTSIAYLPEFGGIWVMLSGGRAQEAIRDGIAFFVRPVTDEHFYAAEAGVSLRWANDPWGPWSEPVGIFNAMTPGQGGYCESMHFADPNGRMKFECPPEKVAMNARLDRQIIGAELAAEYGVAVLPRFARRGHGRELTVYWLMSTWNPYRVVVMRSDLDFGRAVTRDRCR